MPPAPRPVNDRLQLADAARCPSLYDGMKSPQVVTLTEGKLSVYWLPHTSRLRLMRFVTRYLRGRVRQIPGFRSFRTTRMQVQCARPSLDVGVDGELFTLPTPLVLTSFPRSLTVCVPRETSSSE